MDISESKPAFCACGWEEQITPVHVTGSVRVRLKGEGAVGKPAGFLLSFNDSEPWSEASDLETGRVFGSYLCAFSISASQSQLHL